MMKAFAQHFSLTSLKRFRKVFENAITQAFKGF